MEVANSQMQCLWLLLLMQQPTYISKERDQCKAVMKLRLELLAESMCTPYRVANRPQALRNEV